METGTVEDLSKGKPYRMAHFVGYSVSAYPADLLGEDAFWKTVLYGAYDQSVYDRTGVRTIREYEGSTVVYMGWCLRSARFRLSSPIPIFQEGLGPILFAGQTST